MTVLHLEGKPPKKASPKNGAGEPPPGRFDDEPQSDTRRVWTPSGVVATWAEEGPLVHLATGFPTLDDRTGGGPALGSRIYVLGAPDAGKTAFFAQLADVYREKGYAVGYLSVDEEPSDLVTRFMQRRRWLRLDCEERRPEHIERMRGDAAAIDLRIYDTGHTIQSAAEDLDAYAKLHGKVAVLFVDSVQSVAHLSVSERTNERAAVTTVVHAIRRVAVRYRMLVIAASEMNRGGYREENDEEPNDMASAKESGTIEYGARVLLSLRPVKAHPGTIRVHIPKNKLGPRGEPFFLKLDPSAMTLVECPAPSKGDTQKEETKKTKTVREVADVAQAIVKVAVMHPGIGTVELRAKVRALGYASKDVVGAGVEYAIDKGLLANRPEVKGERTYPHFFAVAPGSDGGSG